MLKKDYLKFDICGQSGSLSFAEVRTVLNGKATNIPAFNKVIGDIVADHRAQRRGTYGLYTHMVISRSGVADKNGNPIKQYKGQNIAYLDEIAGYFANSAGRIEQFAPGKNIKINSIDVKTASNESSPLDTITDIKPIERDKKSTSDSADRFGWYNVHATVGGVDVSSGWLCWRDYGYAGNAARGVALSVANYVGRYADGVVRALEQRVTEHAKQQTR
jgi:hypothetical protein